MSLRSAGWSRIASGSRRSAQITLIVPPLSRSARLCSSTMGSLSTYTTRAAGTTFWTTSCVFPTVGSPEPMSTNCRTPCCAIHLAARWWKPRLDHAAVPDLRRGLQDLLGGESVNLEIAIALQHVVVDPGGVGLPVSTPAGTWGASFIAAFRESS